MKQKTKKTGTMARSWLSFHIAGHSNKLTGGALAISFAVIGTALVLATHAATPVISAQPESGTVTGPATTGTDATAAGGKYVQFSTPIMPPPPPPTGGQIPGVSSNTPCIGYSTPPARWNHIVVLMFENQTMSGILSNSQTPYTANFISTKCGSITTYHDANYRVDGTKDGSYNSKPQYAILTNGLPGSTTGFVADTYAVVKDYDNIFNRLNQMGVSVKDYVDAPGANCANNFSGGYHDPMRYYTDLGGQSTSPTTFCNTHDVNLGQFMTDVNSGKLPAFSMIIPTNNENMHSDTWAAGDAFAKSFLTPLLDSAQYKSGDTAIFWLWDEDTATPNAMISPYIKPGSHPAATPSNQPLGHYTMLRTWEDMLGISPLLGNTGQSTSIRSYFEGH